MEVTIVNRGRDGETRCFIVEDEIGNRYEIRNCHLVPSVDCLELYHGALEDGHPVHLNIITENHIELVIQ